MGIPTNQPSQRHLYRVSSQIPQVGRSLHSAICLSCSTTSNFEHHYDLVENVATKTIDFYRNDLNENIDKLDSEEKSKEETLTLKTYELRTQDKYKIQQPSKYLILLL
jgi:hypothetical protein